MIAIPKTKTEQIRELMPDQSINVDKGKRTVFSVIANRVKKDTGHTYTIRTIKETGEIRLWRVK